MKIKEIIKNKLERFFEGIIGKEFVQIKIYQHTFQTIDRNSEIIKDNDRITIYGRDKEEFVYKDNEDYPKILNKSGERVCINCHLIYKITEATKVRSKII